MAFDMGFDFRGTGPYVTDPTYAVPVLTEVFPHTYTNADGLSINAGYDSAANVNSVDRSATNDPRIAGINYFGNASDPRLFKVDLSSGSAPGAGTYTIDLAVGDFGFGHSQRFNVKDTNTVLIDGNSSAADTASNQYDDATLAKVTATTTWTGATVSKTFATTLAQIGLGLQNVGDNTTLAHFRLTLQAAGATSQQLISSLMLLGVGM